MNNNQNQESENKSMLEFLQQEFKTSDTGEIQRKLSKLDKQQQQQLKAKYEQWKEAKRKKQAAKVAHGAKLDYVKSLKHVCPEGQELYYFKKGGNLECGCKGKIMEKGAKVEEAKCGAVAKFKKVKKAGFGSWITKLADATGSNGGFKKAEQESKKKSENKSEQKEGWRGNDYIVRKKNIKEREKQLASNKTKEETTPPNINRGLHKNSKGGAVNAFKAKCGSKMKKHKQGGSLNRIPFYQGGTPENGIQYKPNWYKSIQAKQGVMDNNGNYYELHTKRSRNGDVFSRKIQTLWSQNPVISDTTYEYFPKNGNAEINSTQSLYDHNKKNYKKLKEMFEKIVSIPVNKSPIDLQ